MNPNNYCTLEASQRLVAAGISLETDYLWCETNRGWRLHPKSKAGMYRWKATIPAPSMGELWRELPDEASVTKVGILCKACYVELGFESTPHNNPCDALADLLIFVRKEADNGK